EHRLLPDLLEAVGIVARSVHPRIVGARVVEPALPRRLEVEVGEAEAHVRRVLGVGIASEEGFEALHRERALVPLELVERRHLGVVAFGEPRALLGLPAIEEGAGLALELGHAGAEALPRLGERAQLLRIAHDGRGHAPGALSEAERLERVLRARRSGREQREREQQGRSAGHTSPHWFIFWRMNSKRFSRSASNRFFSCCTCSFWFPTSSFWDQKTSTTPMSARSTDSAKKSSRRPKPARVRTSETV